jgi:hypothetical protein
MMAATFDASGAEPTFGKPVALFTDEYDFGVNISMANYDVTRDGRFIMLRRGTQGGRLRAGARVTGCQFFHVEIANRRGRFTIRRAARMTDGRGHAAIPV